MVVKFYFDCKDPSICKDKPVEFTILWFEGTVEEVFKLCEKLKKEPGLKAISFPEDD